ITELEIRLKPNPNIRGRLITEMGERVPHDTTVLVFNNYEDAPNGMLGEFGTGVTTNTMIFPPLGPFSCSTRTSLKPSERTLAMSRLIVAAFILSPALV